MRYLGLPASVLQRHHAEGPAPTAERTVNPTGASRESLTSNPELENSLGHKQKSSVGLGMSVVGGQAEVDFGRLEVRF